MKSSGLQILIKELYVDSGVKSEHHIPNYLSYTKQPKIFLLVNSSNTAPSGGNALDCTK